MRESTQTQKDKCDRALRKYGITVVKDPVPDVPYVSDVGPVWCKCEPEMEG